VLILSQYGRWCKGIYARYKILVKGVKGLRAFYDLKKDEKDASPNLITISKKPMSTIRVQKTIDEADNTYNRSAAMKIETDNSLPQSIYSLSKSETYFSRPRDLWQRDDGYREYGNLYNPFWQTHLLETSNTDRLAAAVDFASGL